MIISYDVLHKNNWNCQSLKKLLPLMRLDLDYQFGCSKLILNCFIHFMHLTSNNFFILWVKKHFLRVLSISQKLQFYRRRICLVTIKSFSNSSKKLFKQPCYWHNFRREELLSIKYNQIKKSLQMPIIFG